MFDLELDLKDFGSKINLYKVRLPDGVVSPGREMMDPMKPSRTPRGKHSPVGFPVGVRSHSVLDSLQTPLTSP